MKIIKLLLPVFAFVVFSQTTFAQQTKPSETEKMGVAKKDRVEKKEAAHIRPVNANDRLIEKRVYKKERTMKKRDNRPSSDEPSLHKDGRYPLKDKPAKNAKRKKKKAPQIRDKAEKQAAGDLPQNQ